MSPEQFGLVWEFGEGVGLTPCSLIYKEVAASTQLQPDELVVWTMGVLVSIPLLP